MASQLVGDIEVTGSLTVLGGYNGNIARSNLVVDEGLFPIEFDRWRVWDAAATPLPGTPATDDLGITTPTFGSGGGPYISTGDVKALGTTTRRARCVFQVPDNYVDEMSFVLRFYAGMLTTIAATSCTLDVEVFKMSNAGYATGVDMCLTNAQSINSLAFAAKLFVMDTTPGIAPGELLDIRITITAIDAAGATAVIGVVAQTQVLAHVKG